MTSALADPSNGTADSLAFDFNFDGDPGDVKGQPKWEQQFSLAGSQLSYGSIKRELEEHFAISVRPMLTCELDSHGTKITVKNEREFKEAVELWLRGRKERLRELIDQIVRDCIKDLLSNDDEKKLHALQVAWELAEMPFAQPLSSQLLHAIMMAFESALPDDDGFSNPMVSAVCATVLWVLWMIAEKDQTHLSGALPYETMLQYQDAYRQQTADDGLVGMMLDALRIRDKRVDFACFGVLLCMSEMPAHSEQLVEGAAIELLMSWSCRLPQGMLVVANCLSTEARDSGYRETINRQVVDELINE